ncbi:MAG: hypothetical protein RMJ07_00120 [Nitrososphaerota archaeon]|nr:hypothetical protein [Candidatus Bathyarchaeota archaeon]MDW8048079.1 hypothetical protein [Nitrososphaerota archaeon]
MGFTPTEYVNVASLKPNFQDLNLIVKVVSIFPTFSIPAKGITRQRLVTEVLVGDETGTVILTLRDNTSLKPVVNEVIEVRGAYTTLYKGRLRLNVARGGLIRRISGEDLKVNTKNNLSEKTYIQVPWHLSESRPFKKKRRH